MRYAINNNETNVNGGICNSSVVMATKTINNLVSNINKLSNLLHKRISMADGARQNQVPLKSWPARCTYSIVTCTTFLPVLLLGLSLFTAGIFKKYVNPEAEVRKGPHFGLGLGAPIGLAMVIYSVTGLYMWCFNKLVSASLHKCWMVNIGLITLFTLVELGASKSDRLEMPDDIQYER